MYSSAYVWAKILSHMEERLGAVTPCRPGSMTRRWWS